MSDRDSQTKRNWLWYAWPLALILLLVIGRQFFKGTTVSAGERLYGTYCMGCHGENGEGFQRLVPPLAGADYLQKYPDEVPCIILNGLEGEVVVNGITYTQPMGGFKLSPGNVQSIIAYIQSSWGNDGKVLSFQEVKTLMENCPEPTQ